MYIRLPEAMIVVGDIHPGNKRLFLADPNQYNWVEWEGMTKRFREKRRRTFSDVYHVKLMAPPEYDAFPAFKVKWGDFLVCPYIMYTRTDDGTKKVIACSFGATAFCITTSYTSLLSGEHAYATIDIYQFKRRSGARIYYRQAINDRSINADVRWRKDSSGKWYVYSESARTLNYDILPIVKALSHPDNGSASSITQAMMDALYPLACKWHDAPLASSTSSSVLYKEVSYDFPDHLHGDLLNEYEYVFGGSELLLPGTGQYFREVGIQNAYLAAVRDVPRMNDNNLSNLLEIVSFIKSLVIDHKVNIPSSLSSAWLSYRYQYKTTESDFNEAIRFMSRNCTIPSHKPIKSYGTYSLTYKGISVRFNCCLSSASKELELCERIWSALFKYGLAPSFYAIWDMVPYSFIVDWFIPIGTVASVYDAKRFYVDDRKISDVMFSITYDIETDDGLEHHYTRWLSSSPPSLNGFYFLEQDPSNKTIGMRCLDAMSLVIR